MDRPPFYPLGNAPAGLAYLRAEALAPLFREDAMKSEPSPEEGPESLPDLPGATVEMDKDLRRFARALGIEEDAEDDEPGPDYRSEFADLTLEELLTRIGEESRRAEDYERRKAAGEFDVPEDEDPYDPEEMEESEEEDADNRLYWLREALRTKLVEQGYVPVDLGEAEPDESQRQALDMLTDDPAATTEGVRQAIFASFRHFYGDDYWREAASMKPARTIDDLEGQYRLVAVEVPKTKIPTLVFQVEATWEDDHGIYAILVKGKKPQWSTADGLSDVLPYVPEEEPATSPYERLVEALMDGKTKEAERLVAAGADINAVPPDEEPPLCLAVEQEDVRFVERLLAFGADPSLREPENRLTPLMLVRRLRKDMTFGLDMGEGLLGGLTAALDREARKQLKTLDEIEKRLLAARGS